MKITFIEGEFSDRGRALAYDYIKRKYLRMMMDRKENIEENTEKLIDSSQKE